LLKVVVESQRIPDLAVDWVQAECVAQTFRIPNGPGFESGSIGGRSIRGAWHAVALKTDVIAISNVKQALGRQFAVGIIILMKVMNSRRVALDLPRQRMACSQEVS
jgi:phosphoribosyl-dephospho-CoA transferase